VNVKEKREEERGYLAPLYINLEKKPWGKTMRPLLITKFVLLRTIKVRWGACGQCNAALQKLLTLRSDGLLRVAFESRLLLGRLRIR